MPTRIIPKNYRNVTGISAQTKAIGKATFESTLERDFLSIVEFNHLVTSYEVQPITISWMDNEGKQRNYTPDIWVTYKKSYKAKPVLYEVKYRSDLAENWQTYKNKFKAAIHFCKAQNWQFKIITDKEIRAPYLNSVKFLKRYQSAIPMDAHYMTLLANKIRTLKQSTPSELIQSIYQDETNQAKLLTTLWYMIATRQIGINLNQKITMNCPIWYLRG